MVLKKLTWRHFLTVEPVIFIYVYALIMSGPVIQQYVYHRIAESRGFPYKASGHTGCTNETSFNATIKTIEEEVQSMASYVCLGIAMFQALPSIFLSMLIGSWSDSRGRKPVLLLPVIGSALQTTTVLLVMYLRWPLYVLFIGAAANGFCGYLTTLITGTMAYIADTTDEFQRALRLAIMEAFVFTGGMVSYLTSGLWIDQFGFKAPFWFILGCLALAFLYVIFLVPESRVGEDITEKTNLLSCKSIKRVWNVYAVPREGGRRNMFLLTINDGLVNIGIQGTGSVIGLYILRTPLCFSAEFVGYFSALRCFTLGMGAVLGLTLLGRIRIDELNISRIGLLTTIASYILFGFADNFTLVFLVPLVGLLNGCIAPVYKGMLSRIISKDEQGTGYGYRNIQAISPPVLNPPLCKRKHPPGYKSPGYKPPPVYRKQ